MKNKFIEFSRRYQAALRRHLRQGSERKIAPRLGNQAVGAGIEMLGLVRIHEEALAKEQFLTRPNGNVVQLIKKAGNFFAEVAGPIEQTHRAARETGEDLKRLNQILSKRTKALSVSNEELRREIGRRETAERALRKSETHYGSLLRKSALLQEQLRFLSRQILSTQEEERKRISRELHDDIAGTLSVINLELSALKNRATGNNKDLTRKIASTQRLVENSVEVIHRFARDLRPTTLDDLGLIPALHSLTSALSKQAGLRIRLTVFAGVEALDSTRKTVLYRVAQEALMNVVRHANASQAEVNIGKVNGGVCMRITDNGKSFNVDRTLYRRKNKRLGLLGMRERVEMVGGVFTIESVPAQGTSVQAKVPMPRNRRNGNHVKNNGNSKN